MTDYSNIPDCFYRVSIKALVLDEQGRFLLSREYDNRWDFPGGGYDHTDSSPRDALIRELREEMGVEILTMEDTPSYFTTAKHRKWFSIANIFYKTTLKNLDITPSDECQEVQFFTPEEALKLDLFANVIEFCKHYKI